MRSKIRNLEQEIIRSNQISEDRQSENDLLSARLKDTETRLREIPELRDNVETLQGEIDDLKRELQLKNKESDSWRSKYVTLERKLIDIDDVQGNLSDA